MTEQEVVELMRDSKSEDAWNKNCDRIKVLFGGYPSFWYQSILASGLAQKTMAEFDA